MYNFYFIFYFIYKIRHQQNKDKIDNIKNTKAGAVHREELQLRDPKFCLGFDKHFLKFVYSAIFHCTKKCARP